MGRVTAELTVTNMARRERVLSFCALVDTGAQYVCLPERYREALGPLEFSEDLPATFANGSGSVSICWPVFVQINGGRLDPGKVAFIAGLDEPLIGYIALEEANLVVDMVGYRLVSARFIDVKIAL